jgi:hypothetical protein
MIDALLPHLLGRHVTHCPDQGARVCLVSDRLRFSRRACQRLDQLGNAEVKNLDSFLFCYKKILGLHVAVNNAFFMGRSQSARYLPTVLNRFARGDGAILQDAAQRFSFQQFRH